MSKLNPAQRGAFFEKLKKQKGAPEITAPPSPKKMIAPIMPKIPAVGTTDQVNPNFVGSAKKQRFQKLKKIFGP